MPRDRHQRYPWAHVFQTEGGLVHVNTEHLHAMWHLASGEVVSLLEGEPARVLTERAQQPIRKREGGGRKTTAMWAPELNTHGRQKLAPMLVQI